MADIPGTLPLSIVHLENAEGRNPDIVVGYTYDEHAMVQGMPGIEFQGVVGHISRGMHGSFSPVDVHNTLLASGPDFREDFTDTLPSGNVDVAPTIARILGLDAAAGRGPPVARSASGTRSDAEPKGYTVTPATLSPAPDATDLSVKSPDRRDDRQDRAMTFGLQVKELRHGAHSYTYFDWARG